jgi:hypothetical protein
VARAVYTSVIQRAARILGGVDKLAKHLDASPSDVQLWMDGRRSPPPDVFLRAVDVVLERNGPPDSGKGPPASKAPR